MSGGAVERMAERGARIAENLARDLAHRCSGVELNCWLIAAAGVVDTADPTSRAWRKAKRERDLYARALDIQRGGTT